MMIWIKNNLIQEKKKCFKEEQTLKEENKMKKSQLKKIIRESIQQLKENVSCAPYILVECSKGGSCMSPLNKTKDGDCEYGNKCCSKLKGGGMVVNPYKSNIKR